MDGWALCHKRKFGELFLVFLGLQIVAPAEAVDPTFGIDKFLLASIERVALGADRDFRFLACRSDMILGTTGTGDYRVRIVGWVNFSLHLGILLRVF